MASIVSTNRILIFQCLQRFKFHKYNLFSSDLRSPTHSTHILRRDFRSRVKRYWLWKFVVQVSVSFYCLHRNAWAGRLWPNLDALLVRITIHESFFEQEENRWQSDILSLYQLFISSKITAQKHSISAEHRKHTMVTLSGIKKHVIGNVPVSVTIDDTQDNEFSPKRH